MSFVHSIMSLPPGTLLGVSAVIVVLLALWLSSVFSRWHYVTIKRSEETELIAFELRRLADAVERLAASGDTQTQPHAEAPASRPAGLSIFGR